MEKPEFESKKLRLSEIKLSGALLPTAVEIAGYLEPRTDILEKTKSLAKHYSYYGRIDVWQNPQDQAYNLLSSYEQYKALLPLGPDYWVECQVIKTDFKTAKEIALRLRTLTQQENIFERCLNLRLLHSLGYGLVEVKRAYEAKSPADRKRLERDWNIVKNFPLLVRVLGLPHQTPEREFVQNFIQANPREASIKYGVAAKTGEILSDSLDQVNTFIELFDNYIGSIRPVSPNEESEPITRWKNYSDDRVLSLARAVARKKPSRSAKNNYGVGDHGSNDVHIAVRVENKTGVLRVQDISINLKSRSQPDLKKICEVNFQLRRLNNILDKYIGSIRPERHGDSIPFVDHSVDQFINSDLTTFAVRKQGYIEYVMDNRFLRYANLVTLLEELRLGPENFGFKSREFDSSSTYAVAYEAYTRWYKDVFSQDVFVKFNNNFESHPRFPFLSEILAFLEERSDFTKAVYLDQFVIEMFTQVFQILDREKRVLFERAKDIAKSELVFKEELSRGVLDKITQAGLTDSELSQISKVYRRFDNSAVIEATAAATQSMDDLKKDLAEIITLRSSEDSK